MTCLIGAYINKTSGTASFSYEEIELKLFGPQVEIGEYNFQIRAVAEGFDDAVMNITCVVTASSTPSISQLVLVNADNETDIKTLIDGDRIDFGTIGTQRLSIRADFQPSFARPDSVIMEISNPNLNSRRKEGQAPYALFGGEPASNYWGRDFCPGNYTMTATPYRSGVQGQALTVNFQLYGGTGLNVFHLALIDPVTNTEIGSLGSTVPSLPGGISIRADADRCTESVEFIVKDAAGQTLIQRTENIAPYALLGDRSRTFYNPWFPEPGEYSLEVIPYSERNASGLAGDKRITQFTVLENTTTLSEPTVGLYPNPSYDNDVIHISLKHFDNENYYYKTSGWAR